MAYIANRPVRFDRNYTIGEKIPDRVIDPKMTTKLISMGRIIRIPEPQSEQDTPAKDAEQAQDGDNSTDGTNICGDGENAPVSKSDGVDGTSGNAGDVDTFAKGETEPKEYRCAECDRIFTSANGLAAHSRTHKK